MSINEQQGEDIKELLAQISKEMRTLTEEMIKTRKQITILVDNIEVDVSGQTKN